MNVFLPSKYHRQSLAIASLLALAICQYLYSPVSFDSRGQARRNLQEGQAPSPLSPDFRIYDSSYETQPSCTGNSHLRCIHEPPEPLETVLFWHIPKSGGTSVKRLYQCMDKKMAAKSHHFVIQPYHHAVPIKVNIDTTILPGIIKAKEAGLVQSKSADIVVTHDVAAAVQYLFDRENQGRALALFRNPIDRLVSKFFYLQVAHWEKGYRPHWKNMSVLQWAESSKGYAEKNYFSQKLSGKEWDDPVTWEDMPRVKQVLRDHVIVGLMDEMEESLRRFNVVVSMTAEGGGDKWREERCMNELFHPERLGGEVLHVKNKNEHSSVEPGSHEWSVLVKQNELDMHLYGYIEMLFKEQKDILDWYSKVESN